MGKKLSLSERLNNALSVISSETEEDVVYDLLYQTGRMALEYDFDTFYGQILDHESLVPYNEPTQQQDKRHALEGRELARKLQVTIILPERGKRGYRRKHEKAKEREFDILKNFYRQGDGEESIQN